MTLDGKTLKRALSLVLGLLLSGVSGYSDYANRIPNGRIVPNPCDPSKPWTGVGHQLSAGSGTRNQFGRDFAANGHMWTPALCKMDSDGDGLTNGEELGDPGCIWQPGANPTRSTGLSHPGVCEQINSTRCFNYNTFLSSVAECAGKYGKPSSVAWCPSLAQPGVKRFDLKFNNAQIPSTDTTYLCQQFTVPGDQDYQIIGWEPIVSNPELLHHLVLFTCDVTEDLTAFQKQGGYPAPSQCPMSPACGSMSIVWAVGMVNRCYDASAGIPMGKNFYRTVILQIHYNNPSGKSGLRDSSGLRIYYVKRSRPNDNAMIAIGQEKIAIQPKTTTSIVGKGLTTTCSKQRFAPYSRYTLTSLYIHMHRLGNYAKVTLTKGSTGEKTTLIDQSVNYDQPPLLVYGAEQRPVLEPGDNLDIECRYDASNRDDWTFFGDKTQDEMCFAFIDMYPRPMRTMFQMLDNIGDTDYCSRLVTRYGNCSATSFYSVLNSIYEAKDNFTDACSCSSYPAVSCSLPCYNYLKKWNLLDNPCINEQNGTIFYMTTRFWVIQKPAQVYNIQSQAALCNGLKSPPLSSSKCSEPPAKSIQVVLDPPTVLSKSAPSLQSPASVGAILSALVIAALLL